MARRQAPTPELIPEEPDDGEALEDPGVDLADENAQLRAIISAALPDLDLDSAMGEVLYRADGTAVWMGELPDGPPESPEVPEQRLQPAKKERPQPTPGSRSSARRPNKNSGPDLGKMTDSEIRDHYHSRVLPRIRRGEPI